MDGVPSVIGLANRIDFHPECVAKECEKHNCHDIEDQGAHAENKQKSRQNLVRRIRIHSRFRRRTYPVSMPKAINAAHQKWQWEEGGQLPLRNWLAGDRFTGRGRRVFWLMGIRCHCWTSLSDF